MHDEVRKNNFAIDAANNMLTGFNSGFTLSPGGTAQLAFAQEYGAASILGPQPLHDTTTTKSNYFSTGRQIPGMALQQ